MGKDQILPHCTLALAVRKDLPNFGKSTQGASHLDSSQYSVLAEVS